MRPPRNAQGAAGEGLATDALQLLDVSSGGEEGAAGRSPGPLGASGTAQEWVEGAQTVPETQSASRAQEIGHAPLLPSHRKGEHDAEPGSPAAEGVQVPRLALHRSHPPLQAVLQQYPSTQWPLRQAEAERHACPSFSLHTPAAPHVVLPVQILGSLMHAPEPRAHMLHPPVHTVAQQTPFLQVPEPQSSPVVQLWPAAVNSISVLESGPMSGRHPPATRTFPDRSTLVEW